MSESHTNIEESGRAEYFRTDSDDQSVRSKAQSLYDIGGSSSPAKISKSTRRQ